MGNVAVVAGILLLQTASGMKLGEWLDEDGSDVFGAANIPGIVHYIKAKSTGHANIRMKLGNLIWKANEKYDSLDAKDLLVRDTATLPDAKTRRIWMAAINIYTANSLKVFKYANAYARENGNMGPFQTFTDHLNAALKFLGQYDKKVKTTYRGLNLQTLCKRCPGPRCTKPNPLSCDRFFTECDQTVGFWSTSFDPQVAYRFAHPELSPHYVIVKVTSSAGTDIERYSYFAAERERLFLTGVSYHVEEITTKFSIRYRGVTYTDKTAVKITLRDTRDARSLRARKSMKQAVSEALASIGNLFK